MIHTIRHKQKLLARFRRIQAQVEAIERALDGEAGCELVMHLIAGAGTAAACSAARRFSIFCPQALCSMANSSCSMTSGALC